MYGNLQTLANPTARPIKVNREAIPEEKCGRFAKGVNFFGGQFSHKCLKQNSRKDFLAFSNKNNSH